MFPSKLGLYALTLEATAWVGLLLDSSSDAVLLAYLGAHALASFVLALAAIVFLPANLRRKRLPVLLLLTGTGFAVPILGFVAVILGVIMLHSLPPASPEGLFQAVTMPEVDTHQRAGQGFRQAGMRAFISNERAPVATRLRALVALQNVPGNVASPLLRDVLSDPSEDIRLLAYGMLDNKEKVVNNDIYRASRSYQEAAEGSAARQESARRLADLYWELVYQELAQGDLRVHALQQSLQFTQIALADSPDDAALHLRHGRLLQALHQPEEARQAYDQALALGMPKTRIVPYLAEVAFETGRHDEVRALMRELGNWQSLPRLKPVITYWSRT
jgi:tetratricopeptide (TPR) repeat protein